VINTSSISHSFNANSLYNKVMRIPIDRQSKTPITQQLANWLKEGIRAGSLPRGMKLPATRALALELGISRITVQNAYALLESDGLIITREGSGTFVDPPQSIRHAPDQPVSKSWPFWQLAGEHENNPMVPVNVTHSTEKLISFTGVGDPGQFPLQDFLHTLQDVIRRDGIEALSYGHFGAGYEPLRLTISRVLASQGIQTHPEQVLITSGSQQALSLVCQQLLREGDVILVESPTYNLAIDLFRHLKLKIIDVPVDENGLHVELIEPLLQVHAPRLFYTIPNFQNPTGACMSVARRKQLLALAAKYNIPILEDDFAGDLRYDGHSLPAIKALDMNGQVIYIGTFSKMLMPGMRVGYLIADGPIFNQLVKLKFVQDLTTSPLIQRALDDFVTVGRYQAHLRRTTRLYRQRRDALVSSLQSHLPQTTFFIPRGGLFLWLTLPDGVSASELLPLAIQQGVEFAPGTRFFANPEDGEHFIRLNFATNTLEDIETGILRLKSTLQII
jgi:GntR family transcriptional regulator/MocR family aminotransferase